MGSINTYKYIYYLYLGKFGVYNIEYVSIKYVIFVRVEYRI